MTGFTTNMTAFLALKKVLEFPDINNILDVGSGAGLHAEFLRQNGKNVTTNSLIPPADIVGDFLSEDFEVFDAIWAAHVLEHQPNPNLFLKKCFSILREDGILAVTVPPLKHEIVGGHVTLWNAGILLYQCILAGFDCKHAMVRSYGYNISIIVRKKGFSMPELHMDIGDIEKLSQFFPFNAQQGFNGDIKRINW